MVAPGNFWRHSAAADAGPGLVPSGRSRLGRTNDASFWESGFTEAVDKYLRPPLTAAGYPFRYSEIGLKLKEPGHRLASLCVSPQMRQSCREASIGHRNSRSRLESLLRRGNRLIEATKIDVCCAYSCKSCK